ncbi:hypothetical protein HK105_205848 [Polyrhizophydium stewartii]|uniref:Uncharacterized protein n=1 Tax=Polyrhizophydium stewartii TaxID=2732419 RepID=A0ABR4N592_9FUNG
MSSFFGYSSDIHSGIPRFIFAVEYVAIVFEVVGLLAAIANCVYLASKIRKASSGFLLKGLFVVSICIIIATIAQFFMLYIIFSRASYWITSWAITTAQVLIIIVETESIKVFVPSTSIQLINGLRIFNGIIFVVLALPAYLNGVIILRDYGGLATWYFVTNPIWAAYVVFYDLGICAFAAYNIASFSAARIKTMQRSAQAPSGAGTSAASGASNDRAAQQTPSQLPGDAVLEFDAQVRIAKISLVLFFLIDVLLVIFDLLYIHHAGGSDLTSLLLACAYSQLSIACGGPHVSFISLMFYNITQIVLAANGQRSGGRRKGKKGNSSLSTDTSD